MSLSADVNTKINWTGKLSLGVAALATTLAGWSAVEAHRANTRTGEQITVSVERNPWASSVTVDTGFGRARFARE
jgi:hypothetical protein